MASNASGNAPKQFVQRKASTLFLRVPYIDWLAVKYGEKTEFRTIRHDRVMLMVERVRLPTPVVAYTNWRPYKTAPYEYEHQLMVLESHHVEELFLVGQDRDALAREGHRTYEQFRRYWQRRHGVLRPTEKVHVWRLRCWREHDDDEMGRLLLTRLYGEFRNGDLEPDEL